MSSAPDKADCPNELLAGAASTAAKNSIRGLQSVDRLLGSYPSDARLHFLRGSLLAGLQRYDEAREAMQSTITISPDFALARFQLGFLEYTSGEPNKASATWSVLKEQPDGNPLRIFVSGLEALAADRFDEAVALLTDGIAKNTDLEPLNRDMQLIVDTVRQAHLATSDTNETPSATHLLLQRYGRSTKPN